MCACSRERVSSTCHVQSGRFCLAFLCHGYALPPSYYKMSIACSSSFNHLASFNAQVILFSLGNISQLSLAGFSFPHQQLLPPFLFLQIVTSAQLCIFLCPAPNPVSEIKEITKMCFGKKIKKETHLGYVPCFAMLDTYSRIETEISAVKVITMAKAVFFLLKK